MATPISGTAHANPLSVFLDPTTDLVLIAFLLLFVWGYLAGSGRDGKPRYPAGTNGRRLAKPVTLLAVVCFLSAAGTECGWLVTAKGLGLLAVGLAAVAVLVLTTVAVFDWVERWLAQPSTKTGDTPGHPGEESAIREAHRKLGNPR